MSEKQKGTIKRTKIIITIKVFLIIIFYLIDTIGSIDDLIENYQLQVAKLTEFGITKINELMELDCIEMTNFVNFEKGIEVGSSKYINKPILNYLNYLRVGDLLNVGTTYIAENEAKNKANEDDILLALDGAPGRNSIGIIGAFSSGIYKLNCNDEIKGLVYFSINSKRNKRIIDDHSQGTTILHASKAINYLVMPACSKNEINLLNYFFNQIVCIKKKITILKKQKDMLLNKYFTNQ